MINMVKLPTKKSNLFLRVAKGHFATSHSHINYYIDVTTQKSRLSEARAVAKELVSAYQHNTIVDTVLCLDGTQVIGTCLANELTKDGFANMNAHQTIYVITPEYTTGSQIILRDNLAPMVKGKHVLILSASITKLFTFCIFHDDNSSCKNSHHNANQRKTTGEVIATKCKSRGSTDWRSTNRRQKQTKRSTNQTFNHISL